MPDECARDTMFADTLALIISTLYIYERKEERSVQTKQRKRIKVSNIVILLMLIAAFLTGCGSKNTLQDGTDMGKALSWTYDIMGVRYKLYENGYAEIDTILNPYCQLTDTVTYEGKEYAVIKIANHSDGMVTCGIFGGNGEYEAPEDLIIPNAIEEIPLYAFHGCTSSTITLPSNVKYVAEGAFSRCTNIETIEFPDSLEKLATRNLFVGCSSLKHVDLPEDVEYVSATTERLFAGCMALESACIPGGCGGGKMGAYTFSDCEVLKEVTLGDGLAFVGEHAFHNLPVLKEIIFPDSVTEIDDQTFYDCPALKDVWLSDNLSDVPAHMFKQSYGNYDADTSGITIHVRQDLAEYVQNLYPDATVVTK